MDLTGHGPRCTACAAKAQLETFRRGELGMAEHLTRDEMVGVSRQAAREALAGIGVTAVGAGLFAVSGTLMCAVLACSGFGMLAHGLHRRRMARRAIGDVPDARVVKR